MPETRTRLLESIINARTLYPVFQPVYELGNPRVVGYEALIRGPADSELHNPINLFDAAKKSDLSTTLEYICCDISCVHFVRYNLPGKLFLNVSPMSFVNGQHVNAETGQILKKHGLAADRIVIELSEQYPMDDYEIIRLAARHYLDMGFEIAIDDLGVGYSGLRIWSEINPNYVKIDRHFIENINENPVKREFVRSIHDISLGLGCRVIAEGIETSEELSTLKSIGIAYGQGFLLGRPAISPARSVPLCLLESSPVHAGARTYRRSESVRTIMDHAHPLSPDISLAEAADQFEDHPAVNSFPVVEQERPLGIVMRKTILELFLGQYGRALNARKPIGLFMETPVIVEHDSHIEEVSRTITERKDLDISIDFIIVKQGRFLGTGSLRKLLQRITDMQIRSARYSNPLTLLPGNVPVYERVDELIGNRTMFSIAYFDINNFKPYNDKYGYSRGDEIIVRLGETLRLHIDPGLDFVGHIGGDDFVALFLSQDWLMRCQKILGIFERLIPEYYNSEDLARGGIHSIDRRGEQQFYPLMSLAIGVACPDPDRCTSHHDVAALATDAKHHAKINGGNFVFVSRRRGKEQNVGMQN